MVVVIALIIIPNFTSVDLDLDFMVSKDDDSYMPDNFIHQPDAEKILSNTPKAFTENHGQLENDEVRFYAPGGGVWFTDDGVWFEVREELSSNSRRFTVYSPESRLMTDDWRPTTIDYKRVVLKQEFIGANHVQPVGRERLSWNSNFFYGNDSSKWCTEVPNYAEIWFENIYDGIDLRYYTNERGLKYDFIVHPGADVSQIRIRYDGAEKLLIDESGNLIIKTQFEEIVDGGLFIYQDYSGYRNPVKGSFMLFSNLEYGFEILGEYYPHEILIIDPNLRLEYSTYIGGSGYEVGRAIAIDPSGNAFVTGELNSLDFPNTTGAYDITYNDKGLYCDFFVLKLNPNGSTLIYSTYVGGNNFDYGWDIAINSNGSAFVTGWTHSSDFPTTTNAFDRTFNVTVGQIDAFALKLASNGSMLDYSTFIGGYTHDLAYSIAVDPNDNVFVSGATSSSDFPTTTGVFDTFYDGGSDCFVFKLNNNGSAPIYSTFIGGSLSEGQSFYSLALDSSGNVFLTGKTNSTDFPITTGAYDTSLNGAWDIFAIKLNWNGSKLLYSTYLGLDDSEFVSKNAIDLSGNATMIGYTSSPNFPITPEAYDTTYNGGEADAFVLKLNKNGSAIIYSTFIGGNNYDRGYDIEMDSIGNAYITGFTNSSDFPTTPDAYDRYCDSLDTFFLKLNSNGSRIEYSTYIGGSSDEVGSGIALDSKNNVFITGYTDSPDFPTTSGAFNTTRNGAYDIFVLKLLLPVNITSVELLKDDKPTDLIYSRLCPYTFRVNITDPVSLLDLKIVHLNLDPFGTNLKLQWDQVTNQFSKIFDPNNYVTLESSSRAYNNSIDKWTINFNITFNWIYPDEDFHDVQIYVTSFKYPKIWLNTTNLYSIENDLVFNGTLSVKGEDNRTIVGNGLVRGGEQLNWTGLTPIYEGTTDIYPPEEECNITLWDENGNSWEDSPPEGEPFNIETLTPNTTNTNGYTHTINISGIPFECDKTNETFTIMIDGNNVTFSDPSPNNKTWQTESSFVPVGIKITDIGGGDVKGSSVKYSYSTDNQISWSNWKSVPGLNSDVTISPKNTILLKEGTNNFVKWRASDSVGNGPTESEIYRILVDISNVEFTNPIPLFEEESANEKVQVGITISDKISGINGSSIEYSISSDNGTSWSSWAQVNKVDNGSYVNVTLNLTFPNGTGNIIKWRASDNAGNGPTESMPYKIIVNTWLQTFIPKVELITPENSSIIPSTSVELSWMLKNKHLVGVNYDMFLDTLNPPVNLIEDNLTDMTLRVTDLSDGETYYWTVVPKFGNDIGWCDSGVWSFSINTSVPYPTVQLISPENGSIITSPRPTFQWSVEYDGAEKLSYNIYICLIENPIEFVKSSKTYYLPENILEDNTTYYWKIVPWAGNVKGLESETWSFTVKKDYIPKFGINLTIDPAVIELEPGGLTAVKAKVINLGELVDTISLSVEIPPEADVGAMVNEPINLELAPEDNGSFNITVTTTEDIKQDEIVLTIVATSEKAIEYGKTVEKREELLVKIIKESESGKEKSDSIENYWIYLIVIIIIILIIIILYLKRRKRAKDELPTSETVTIKPMPPSDLEKPQEQLSPTPTIAQPPTISTHESEIQSIAPGTGAPELPSLSTESHENTPQQMPQVQPKPQLPPAQNQNTISDSNNNTN